MVATGQSPLQTANAPTPITPISPAPTPTSALAPSVPVAPSTPVTSASGVALATAEPAQPAVAMLSNGEVNLRTDQNLSKPAPLPAAITAPLPVPQPATVLPKLSNKSPAREPVAAAGPVSATAPKPKPIPAQAQAQAQPQAQNQSQTPSASAAPAASSADLNDPAAQIARQRQDAREALAQAQTLWNSGNQAGAVEVLQGAVNVGERNAQGAAASALTPPLLAQVRELARMYLALGRSNDAYNLLTRFEPRMSGQSDMYAMRANAAQRLGNHQQSVQDYTVALQSRPDEQRWLLGMAVSLAAMGQTKSAADMYSKARAVGPVSRDVTSYLQQAGVPVKE